MAKNQNQRNQTTPKPAVDMASSPQELPKSELETLAGTQAENTELAAEVAALQSSELESEPVTGTASDDLSAIKPGDVVTASPAGPFVLITNQPPIEQAEATADDEQLSPEDRLEFLKEHRAFLQEQLTEVERQRVRLQQAEAQLAKDLDEITQQIEAEAPPETAMDNIQAYIQRQQEVREERALRKRQLLEAGVSPVEIRSMEAPVDQRLSARRKSDRPTVARVSA